MKIRIAVMFLVVGFLFSANGCSTHKSDSGLITNLTVANAIRIAKATAQEQGYDLSKYDIEGCHYEFIREDHSWSVFFIMKPPTPPGGHFIVRVDDQTKKATLMPGE